MYIKAPKRIGESYAAAVVESGERTRCFFPGTVVCDVDDVFVRFVAGSVPAESAEKMDQVVKECFAASSSWCGEHGLESPADFSPPLSLVSDGVSFLKARVPRDGRAFSVGDRLDICLCIRDVKLSGGRLLVNWRVDSYEQVSSDVSHADEDNGEDARAEEGQEIGEANEPETEPETDLVKDGVDDGVHGESPETAEAAESEIVLRNDEEFRSISSETEPYEEDVVESGLRSVRKTLELLQTQMDEVERARKGIAIS